MPGPKPKPPRLYFREDERTWVILDRGRQIRTGCSREQTEAAAQALSNHIGRRFQRTAGERDPAQLAIADVIVAYEQTKRPRDYDELRATLAARRPITPEGRKKIEHHDELVYRLQNINTFMGGDKIGEIKKQLCTDYVDWRTHRPNHRNDMRAAPPPRRQVSNQSARRELEDLRAAIGAWHADFVLNFVPVVTLPAKAEGRKRWLTRIEAARLLGAALGFVFDGQANTWKRDDRGRLARRDRVTRTRRRHAARFILVGLYSGRREETIRRTLWRGSTSQPSLDLEHMVYHGRGIDELETRKRRPPARIATRLRPHLKRWRAMDLALEQELGSVVQHVVHRPDGRPLLGKIKTAWNGILQDAALGDDVVRHALRHTAATWLMQSGIDRWQAAGFLGMTVEQLEEGYGHQHPDFQQDAAAAFTSKRA
jgi:integrase